MMTKEARSVQVANRTVQEANRTVREILLSDKPSHAPTRISLAIQKPKEYDTMICFLAHLS